jgi:hypothetical protein
MLELVSTSTKENKKMTNSEINCEIMTALDRGCDAVDRLRRKLKRVRTLELRIDFHYEVDRTGGGLLNGVTPDRLQHNYTPSEMRKILR